MENLMAAPSSEFKRYYRSRERSSPLTWPQATIDRFWDAVIKTDGCWGWWSRQNIQGYSIFTYFSHPYNAHRVCYILTHGEPPEGYLIDHLCRNRACVNPEHLEAVTLRENSLRGVGVSAINIKKTHCANGHEFTPKNTHYYRKGNGVGRHCRACDRVKHRLGALDSGEGD